MFVTRNKDRIPSNEHARFKEQINSKEPTSPREQKGKMLTGVGKRDRKRCFYVTNQ